MNRLQARVGHALLLSALSVGAALVGCGSGDSGANVNLNVNAGAGGSLAGAMPVGHARVGRSWSRKPCSREPQRGRRRRCCRRERRRDADAADDGGAAGNAGGGTASGAGGGGAGGGGAGGGGAGGGGAGGGGAGGGGCAGQCQTSTCGNGVIEGQEVCDDGNAFACGSCNALCSVVTAAQAKGSITTVAGSALSSGDTFTLTDGINAATVFEFNTGSVGLGHVKIALNVADTAAAVATKIAAAINGVATSLLIGATASGSLVSLIHDRATALGNQPILETVTAVGFTVTALAGGGGDDCALGNGCKTADDCASHNCSPSQHCE